MVDFSMKLSLFWMQLFHIFLNVFYRNCINFSLIKTTAFRKRRTRNPDSLAFIFLFWHNQEAPMAKGLHSVSFTQPSYFLSGSSFTHLPQSVFNNTKLLLVPGPFLVFLYFHAFYSHCSLCQPCPSLWYVVILPFKTDTRKLFV